MLEIKSELQDLTRIIETVDQAGLTKEIWENKVRGLERLFQLAEHGNSGKLIQDKFDISVFHKVLRTCHTIGCMLGECPGVFEEWKYGIDGFPCIESVGFGHTQESAQEFFVLTEDEYRHLFVYGQQKRIFSYKKCAYLYGNASIQTVSDDMLDFIQFKMREVRDEFEYIVDFLRTKPQKA